MIGWKIFKGSKQEWNESVIRYGGDYRQLWNWGEYKESENWRIIRLCKNLDNKLTPEKLVQITYKTFWPICFVYAPGGVNCKKQTGFDKYLHKYIFKKFKFFIVILRVDSHYPKNQDLEKKLIDNKWRIPKYRNNVGLSSIINIGLKHEGIDILNNASSKWKYNYRRSEKNDLIFNFEKNLDEKKKKQISNLCEQMMNFKNIHHIHNPSAILDIYKFFEEDLIIISSQNNYGEMIGFRAALQINDFAWDLMAATNEKGRKLKCSYPLLIKLLNECKQRGAKKYSLAGITPGTNRSIFKIEAGGKIRSFIGEYEICSVSFINFIFSYFLIILKSPITHKLINFLLKPLKFITK